MSAYLELDRVITDPSLVPEAGGRVATTTLLPGGSQVYVLVRPMRGDRFFVSDGGAGFEEVLALGHMRLTRGDTRKAGDIAERLGLAFDGTAFSLADIAPEQLYAAAAYVAEAGRAWSAEVLAAVQSRREATIAEQVGERLQRIFPARTIARERVLVGASNKGHRFDFVVDLAGERHALFEIVTPAPNSLSATHLKFFDLAQNHEDWPREAVAESLEEWASEDVALLSQVTSHVRDMRSEWRDLNRIL